MTRNRVGGIYVNVEKRRDVTSRKFGSVRVNELTHTLALVTNQNETH